MGRQQAVIERDMKMNRLAGHALVGEGQTRDTAGRPIRGAGVARCKCGDASPVLPNCNQRKKWYLRHKDEKRAERDT